MEGQDFIIRSRLPVSQAFLQRNIHSFSGACDLIAAIPFGRNRDKSDLLSVFIENCATCSTKHALLYQLAIENEAGDVRLMLGIFKLSGRFLDDTFAPYGLKYIPEAHNYLRLNGKTVDCTLAAGRSLFAGEPDMEIEIGPGQITDFKVSFHKAILAHWLSVNPQIKLSPEELWQVREECIRLISR